MSNDLTQQIKTNKTDLERLLMELIEEIKLFEYQWELLKLAIVNNCFYTQEIASYLETLSRINSLPQFQALISLVQLEQQQLTINLLINQLSSAIEKKESGQTELLVNLKAYLQLCSVYLSQIDESSAYFQSAQTIKAQLLIQLKSSLFSESFLKEIGKIFSHAYVFYPLENPRKHLDFIIIEASIRAGNSQLGMTVINELLGYLTGLKKKKWQVQSNSFFKPENQSLVQNDKQHHSKSFLFS